MIDCNSVIKITFGPIVKYWQKYEQFLLRINLKSPDKFTNTNNFSQLSCLSDETFIYCFTPQY